MGDNKFRIFFLQVSIFHARGGHPLWNSAAVAAVVWFAGKVEEGWGRSGYITHQWFLIGGWDAGGEEDGGDTREMREV